MTNETRSLWEQLDSEVDPWRRGRIFLVLIGIFHFLTQVLVIAASAFLGNFDRAAGLAVAAVFFWLLFYFIWIGVHWIRWLWGAWDLSVGFCLLIWAWRDMSGMETISGTLTFVIGFILCFSPSIYFFARRQREIVRWRESVLIGAVCFLLLITIATAFWGLVAVREQWRQEAVTFANEANHRIYHDRDYDWVRAHVTPSSFQQHGTERLQYFFESNRKQLGQVGQFAEPHLEINLRLQWPHDLAATARVDCRAETANGPVALHEILMGNGDDWQIDRMWWTYLPLPAETPSR